MWLASLVAVFFCCGAECGIVATGAANIQRHWNTVTGAPTAITTQAHSGGGLRSYQFASSAGAEVSFDKTYTANQITGRLAIRFDSTLPTADMAFVYMIGAQDMSIRYRSSDSKLVVIDELGVTAATGPVVTTNTWYVIDWAYNISVSANTGSFAVNGTSYTCSPTTTSTGTYTTLIIGANANAVTTGHGTIQIDDIFIDNSASAFPLGDGYIVGLSPTGDGTHSFNLNTDFKYENTTNIATNATDTWTHVDDVPMTGITDFIAAAGAAAGEYVEWTFTNSQTGSARAVECVMAAHSASTTANKQSLRMYISTSFQTPFTDVDYSDSSIDYGTSQLGATAPDGTAWNSTAFSGLRARWGSSWTTVDISPVPFIDALMLEAEYQATGGGGGPTFQLLRKRDPDGLSGQGIMMRNPLE